MRITGYFSILICPSFFILGLCSEHSPYREAAKETTKSGPVFWVDGFTKAGM
jgi:hypothetical protein